MPDIPSSLDGGAADGGSDAGFDGGADMEVCTREGAAEFCFRLGKNCGVVSGIDNCGDDREIDCGACDTPCGEIEENVCGCPCDIDGECYIPGEANPDDSCLVCDPDADASGWTVNDGGACDDGNPCSGESRCNAGGNCAPIDFDGCEQLAGECEVGTCDTQQMSCTLTPVDDGIPCTDDGLACTTDQCGSGACEHVPDAGTCAIDGVCYADGDPNPDNNCEICDSATSGTTWTSKAAGDSCADGDGLACTSGQCDDTGTCSPVLDADSCVIDGACYSGTERDPASECRVCEPATSTTAWTNRGQGTSCADGDGLSCTSGLCDGNGVCGANLQNGNCLINGVCYGNGTDNPANSCQTCDTSVSTTQFSAKSNGAGCGSAFSCTTGSCQSGQCQETIDAASCLIASTCYPAGVDNPDNDCQTCDPTSSQTDWSNKADATSCGAIMSCTCTAGACLRTNGNACN